MKNSVDFGHLIETVRKEQGLTQAQLASLSNVGVRFISDLEKGKKTCQLQKALQVARILGIQFTTNKVSKDK